MSKFLVPDKRVIVIGDIGVDEYVTGSVTRISPEAPVPVLEAKATFHRLGLSGNVARNIVSLGSKVHLISVIGNDKVGGTVDRLLNQAGISNFCMILDGYRKTTLKTRVMSGSHQIVRIDWEETRPVRAPIEENLLKTFTKQLPYAHAVIIQDYGKGCLTKALLAKIIKLAVKQGTPVIVDPCKDTPVEWYRGADVMTPNLAEAMALGKRKVDFTKEIISKAKLSALIVTLGAEGMSLHVGKRPPQIIPTKAREPVDVTGAGDTVVAVIALGMASGLSLAECCELANRAAAVVIGKLGCGTCTIKELETLTNG